MTALRVFVGFDERERAAYEVAVHSLRLHARHPVTVIPLELKKLRAHGLYTRPTRRLPRGLHDVISDAPMSTEFGLSRFLTPILAQSGLALFVDCDVVFRGDVYELLDEVHGQSFGVACVQHDYVPKTGLKMDGIAQSIYPRKNWSSVALWNCDNPRVQTLSLDMVNSLPGWMLHRFCFLQESDLIPLDPKWNWLVGEQEMPHDLRIAHFTLGGPWFADRDPKPHDELWLEAREQCTRN